MITDAKLIKDRKAVTKGLVTGELSKQNANDLIHQAEKEAQQRFQEREKERK